jgi:hypothetical protein
MGKWRSIPLKEQRWQEQSENPYLNGKRWKCTVNYLELEKEYMRLQNLSKNPPPTWKKSACGTVGPTKAEDHEFVVI